MRWVAPAPVAKMNERSNIVWITSSFFMTCLLNLVREPGTFTRNGAAPEKVPNNRIQMPA